MFGDIMTRIRGLLNRFSVDKNFLIELFQILVSFPIDIDLKKLENVGVFDGDYIFLVVVPRNGDVRITRNGGVEDLPYMFRFVSDNISVYIVPKILVENTTIMIYIGEKVFLYRVSCGKAELFLVGKRDC